MTKLKVVVEEVRHQPLLWTLDEVAALLRAPMAVIDRYADDGILHWVQLESGARRFRPQDVLDFVNHLPVPRREAGRVQAR